MVARALSMVPSSRAWSQIETTRQFIRGRVVYLAGQESEPRQFNKLSHLVAHFFIAKPLRRRAMT